MKNLFKTLALASLIAVATVSTAFASPVAGLLRYSDTVLKHSTDSYNVVIRGGEYTHISFSGDGDTDVDCYVYDSAGNLVVQDINPEDECRMQVYSPFATVITIDLKNLGSVRNNYTLTVR